MKALTPTDVASALKCRVRIVYGLIRRGELASFRLRRQIRVLESDLVRFIEFKRGGRR